VPDKNENPDQNSQSGIGESIISHFKRQKRPSTSLRMTPMIDVIFLLLTFFVLTAKFRIPEQFLPIQLPRASAKVESFNVVEPLVLNMSTTENGYSVEIGGISGVEIEENAPEEGLAVFAGRLAEIVKAQSRTASDPLEIHCDNDVSWDAVVKVYNVLYAMGANDITFGMNE